MRNGRAGTTQRVSRSFHAALFAYGVKRPKVFRGRKHNDKTRER